MNIDSHFKLLAHLRSARAHIDSNYFTEENYIWFLKIYLLLGFLIGTVLIKWTDYDAIGWFLLLSPFTFIPTCIVLGISLLLLHIGLWLILATIDTIIFLPFFLVWLIKEMSNSIPKMVHGIWVKIPFAANWVLRTAVLIVTIVMTSLYSVKIYSLAYTFTVEYAKNIF